MPVPLKDPVVPTDKLPNMVAWYRLETSSIVVNFTQMKYVLLTATKQEHCTSPLWYYCDFRSPVYSMTSRKLCTVTQFMKDTENVKNYCKTELEPKSVLPRVYHVIDWLWFTATQNTLTLTVVCSQKQKETVIVNLPLVIIILNMSCTVMNSYMTLLPYHHNENKSNLED